MTEDKKPKKHAVSWAEVVQTGMGVLVAIGTLFLVGHAIGWW